MTTPTPADALTNAVMRIAALEDALCRAYAGVACIKELARPKHPGEGVDQASLMKMQNVAFLVLRDIKLTMPGIVQGPDEGQSADTV